MGPGVIVSVDYATMEAIWTSKGSEARAPLAEGPHGFAIASFANRTYRSEVPNLMLQVVAPSSMASKPDAGAPKAAQRKQMVLKRPAALNRPAAARSEAAPAPHIAGSAEDCATFF